MNRLTIDTFLNMKNHNILEKNEENVKICNIVKIELFNNKKKIETGQLAQLHHSENSWSNSLKNNYSDDKHIIGILNKLNETNYEKSLSEIKNSNFQESKLVDIIFTKANKEPGFLDIYIKLCHGLNLFSFINEKCINQFKNKKHVNLMKFIIASYKKGYIINIRQFVDCLLEEITDINIELFIEIDQELKKELDIPGILKSVGVSGHKTEIEKLKPRIKFLFKDILKSYGIVI
jgi:hypothetical protein